MSYPMRAPGAWGDQPLPHRQAQVLEFIDAELSAGRPFPSATAVSAHIGWRHAASATDCLNRLWWRGYIIRGKERESWSRTDKRV